MISDKKRKWRRINGLSLPLDGFQIIAWIFTLLFTLVYFGAIVQSFPNEQCQLVLIILMAILLFIHIFLHISCNFVDPADPAVRAKKQIQPLPNFNRKKHLRVIENQFCNICEVKVGSKSKHCSSCNKCIDGFDHHCKWLNNCVGKRNYNRKEDFMDVLSATRLVFYLISSLFVASFWHLSTLLNGNNLGYIFMQAIFYFAETISTNATNINQDIANSSSIGGYGSASKVLVSALPSDLRTTLEYSNLKQIQYTLRHLGSCHKESVACGNHYHSRVNCNSIGIINSSSWFSSSSNVIQAHWLPQLQRSAQLSQNNKRISPHKPSSLENSNPSLHRSKPITM
ncbi:putative palmitoyltransferase ZDHHC11 [Nymphon striatum]|nr:putative palmitoyltransferase ZDHHC11 [Nymphon striatum]